MPAAMNTDLIALVKQGNLARAKHWLRAGGAGDLNACDALTGNTPLHWASSIGDSAMVQVLLGAGAACEARNCAGDTPLSACARFGRAHIVRLLLAAGAALHTRNSWHDT